MFAHELLNVIGAEGVLAARSGSFPAAKGLDAGPCAGGGAAAAIGVGHAGFDAGEEFFLFLAVLGENAGGPFYAPSYDNVARASYPLARLIYFNTNKAPGRPLNPAIEEFLRFVLSKEGQQLVLDQAVYLPLRATQAESSRTLLDR